MCQIFRLVVLCLMIGIATDLHASDYRTGAELLDEKDSWLQSAAAQVELANLLTYQTASGGWCKGYDARKPRDAMAGAKGFGGWNGTPTIDNGATYSEIRVLARAFTLTGKQDYQQACQRGLTFLLDRQYANGGWPQRSPKDPGDHSYGTHITFNDNAMTEVLVLLEDILAKKPEFAWVDADGRARIQTAFDRGIDCILRCQVRRGDTLTAWCQQHDEITLAPTNARKYELPSLASSESARIVALLMRLPAPDERVRAAVDAAHQWFVAAQIAGKRIAERDDDRVLVDDANAPLLWARFYDLESGKAFFCDRDGVKRDDWSLLSRERRNGYAWYGTWGDKVLRDHPRWSERLRSQPKP